MNGFIAWLSSRLCLRREAKVLAAPVEPGLDRREVARRLTQELDAALERGNHALAERIAASAMRIAALHPHLSERIARLRLAQGQPETALRIIESCIWQSASLRLLRNICWLSLGRQHEAHLDLQQWSARAAAPLRARQLLALLEHRAGDDDAAIRALLRNLKQIEDPVTLCMLTLIGTAQQRTEWASGWITRLRAANAADRSADLMNLALSTVDQAMPTRSNQASNEYRIETLARELVANEFVLPILVEAQRWQPDEQSMSMLIAALEQALPAMEDDSNARLALEQLRAMAAQPHAFIEAQPTVRADAASDVLATIGKQDLVLRERAA